jgi:hypothetical protein
MPWPCPAGPPGTPPVAGHDRVGKNEDCPRRARKRAESVLMLDWVPSAQADFVASHGRRRWPAPRAFAGLGRGHGGILGFPWPGDGPGTSRERWAWPGKTVTVSGDPVAQGGRGTGKTDCHCPCVSRRGGSFPARGPALCPGMGLGASGWKVIGIIAGHVAGAVRLPVPINSVNCLQEQVATVFI